MLKKRVDRMLVIIAHNPQKKKGGNSIVIMLNEGVSRTLWKETSHPSKEGLIL